MTVKSYRDLLVWQKGVDLVVDCYHVAEQFPTSETYGLTSQLQRAAVSIPANVAEGAARQHTPEYIQHLAIAVGSLAELETHIEIAKRLHYITAQEAERLYAETSEVNRMLCGLQSSLRRKLTPATSQ